MLGTEKFIFTTGVRLLEPYERTRIIYDGVVFPGEYTRIQTDPEPMGSFKTSTAMNDHLWRETDRRYFFLNRQRDGARHLWPLMLDDRARRLYEETTTEKNASARRELAAFRDALEDEGMEKHRHWHELREAEAVKAAEAAQLAEAEQEALRQRISRELDDREIEQRRQEAENNPRIPDLPLRSISPPRSPATAELAMAEHRAAMRAAVQGAPPKFTSLLDSSHVRKYEIAGVERHISDALQCCFHECNMESADIVPEVRQSVCRHQYVESRASLMRQKEILQKLAGPHVDHGAPGGLTAPLTPGATNFLIPTSPRWQDAHARDDDNRTAKRSAKLFAFVKGLIQKLDAVLHNVFGTSSYFDLREPKMFSEQKEQCAFRHM